MVDEGKVQEEDMRGNNMADKAADMGAIESQEKVHSYRPMYSWRRKHYRMLVTSATHISWG